MSSLHKPSFIPLPKADSGWNLEMLWRMDWKRFQEVVSLMLARSGLETEIAWTRTDGTTVLGVTNRKNLQAGEALLLCSGWTQYETGAQALVDFCKSLASSGASRGIYVTAGIFDPHAKLLARRHRVELIDGSEFLATLDRIPAEEQQYLRRLAMVGQWDVPTCPSCAGKLELTEIAFPNGVDQKELKDITFKEKRHVAAQLFCRHLLIKPSADILFLKGVEAESMTVEGRVMGNIVCRGRLIVASGACVSGLVAARSVKLEPGGLLEAEARILNETEIQPVRAQPKNMIWKCTSRKKCNTVLPIRHR